MTFSNDQVAELKQLCAEVQCCDEAGCTYLLLPGLRLPPGCSPASIDALFCPTARDGYASRLFFAERISHTSPLNWNATRVRILDRNWDAFSWKVSDEPSLIKMVAAHLRAFR